VSEWLHGPCCQLGLNRGADFCRKHTKFYGILACEGCVVGERGAIYTHTYFLKNNYAKFHLGLAFPNLFPIYFLSGGLVLLDPGHSV